MIELREAFDLFKDSKDMLTKDGFKRLVDDFGHFLINPDAALVIVNDCFLQPLSYEDFILLLSSKKIGWSRIRGNSNLYLRSFVESHLSDESSEALRLGFLIESDIAESEARLEDMNSIGSKPRRGEEFPFA